MSIRLAIHRSICGDNAGYSRPYAIRSPEGCCHHIHSQHSFRSMKKKYDFRFQIHSAQWYVLLPLPFAATTSFVHFLHDMEQSSMGKNQRSGKLKLHKHTQFATAGYGCRIYLLFSNSRRTRACKMVVREPLSVEWCGTLKLCVARVFRFMCQQLHFNFKIIFVRSELRRHRCCRRRWRRRRPVYGHIRSRAIVIHVNFICVCFFLSTKTR